MDPRERYEDPLEAFNTGFDGRQAEVWTAFPAVVVTGADGGSSFDVTECTVSVQPALSETFKDPSGKVSQVNLPPLIHCPVFFPSGGGFTLTFPIAAGDEGLVVIASRCIDAWWQNSCGSGGTVNPQAQIELRMHDLSDGFFLPKVWSKPKVIPSISPTTTQFRSDDGMTFVELTGSHAINVTTTASGGVITATASGSGGKIIANAQSDITATSATGNIAVTASAGTITATDGGGSILAMNGDGTTTLTSNLKVVGTLEVTETATFDSGVIGDSTADFSGEVTANGHSVGAHTHGGVASGSAHTSPPTG